MLKVFFISPIGKRHNRRLVTVQKSIVHDSSNLVCVVTTNKFQSNLLTQGSNNTWEDVVGEIVQMDLVDLLRKDATNIHQTFIHDI